MTDKTNENISGDINNIIENSLSSFASLAQNNYKLPSKKIVIDIIDNLINLTFPGYFCDEKLDLSNLQQYISEIGLSAKKRLTNQIYSALIHSRGDCGEPSAEVSIKEKSEKISVAFFNSFIKIREIIETDIQAAFDGDPAATDKDIIIITYPGIFAVSIYRMANTLHKLGVPYIPRMMTEYAHSKTGIDIHPGAEIGKYFFIDHGTGVVIGETVVIGDNVKIYQGVTLGALSTKGGQSLRGVKRHPTIGNNVTIYSGATVLGGETVIGNDVVVGGNAFITKSV